MLNDQLPLSCYIRTLNEARILERTIRAAQQIAAEVVVVDSGSTDGTIEIAERLGARVLRQKWLGNGLQKRVGEDNCTNDWLLDLDADEVVTPELAEEIRALFANGEPPVPIYAITMITVSPMGRRFDKVRTTARRKLYDRRVVRMPANRAWDQFTLPPGAKVGHLKHTLDHFSYSDFGQLLAKQNSSTTARARETALPSRWSIILRILFAWPFYFFSLYVLRGNYRSGLDGFIMATIVAFGRWMRDVKRYERSEREMRERQRGESGAGAKPGT